MAISTQGKSDIFNGEIVLASSRDAEHVLDVTLRLTDGEGKIGARRSPVAEHHVFVSGAIEHLVSIFRRVGQAVVHLHHLLGRSDVERPTDKNGVIGEGRRIGGRIDSHETNGIIEVARKVDTTAVENLVVEGKGSTFGVTFGESNIRKLPVISCGICIGILELVAFQGAFLTSHNGQNAVGAKDGMTVDGVRQGSVGFPSTETAIKVDISGVHRILLGEGGIITAGDDNL